MAKDPFKTKDGHHIDVVLVLGRCTWCGRLADERWRYLSHPFCGAPCKRAYLKVKEVHGHRG